MSEWKVSYTDGKVAIRSDDFTHDAVLYLTGDFATHEVAINYAAKLAARLNANNLPTPTKSVVPEGLVMEQKFDVAFEALRKIEEMTFPEGRVYEIAHKTLCDIDAMIQVAPTANEKLTPAKLAVDTDVSVSGGLIAGWRPGEEK